MTQPEMYNPMPALKFMLAVLDLDNDQLAEMTGPDADLRALVQSLGSVFLAFGLAAVGPDAFRAWLDQHALDQDVDPLVTEETDE